MPPPTSCDLAASVCSRGLVAALRHPLAKRVGIGGELARPGEIIPSMLAAAGCTFVIGSACCPRARSSPSRPGRPRRGGIDVFRSSAPAPSAPAVSPTVSPSSAASQSFCASALLKSTPGLDSPASFLLLVVIGVPSPRSNGVGKVRQCPARRAFTSHLVVQGAIFHVLQRGLTRLISSDSSISTALAPPATLSISPALSRPRRS